MLVKSFELADECARVLRQLIDYKKIITGFPALHLEDDAHPVVDVVHHLVVLPHNHVGFKSFCNL